VKKLSKILLITIICFGLSTPLLGQEKGGTSPIIAVSKEAKLKTTRTTAILLSGNDPLLTRVVEDVLAIHLTNAGFTVINREILEKSVGEQVAKKKKEKAEGAINALEVGTAVNADSILTGTIVIESGEQRSLLTKVASFQLVDVASGKTIMSIVFEPEKGESFSKIGKGFVDVLKQAMK
jgi:hypothetical protein